MTPWSASTASRRTTTAPTRKRTSRCARRPRTVRVRRGRPALARRSKPLLDGVDVVFHQAAQAGVRLSWSGGFADYVGHNVLATQRLLEAVHARASAARVVYASSSSVYGNQPRYPDDGDRSARSRSARTASPSSRPSICAGCTPRTGACTTVSLRYFTVFGPRQRPDMSIHRLCEAAIRRHRRSRATATERRSASSPTSTTSCAANLAAAEADVAPGTYVNVAGGGEITFNDLIALVGELAGAPVAIDAAADASRRLRPQRRRDRPRARAARLGADGLAPRRHRRADRLAPVTRR